MLSNSSPIVFPHRISADPRSLPSRMHQTVAGLSPSLPHPPTQLQQQAQNLIHVCCQSNDCGATLQIKLDASSMEEVSVSHSDGTREVLVRCGNCRRLLRVQLPAAFLPATPSSCNSLAPDRCRLAPRVPAAARGAPDPGMPPQRPAQLASNTRGSNKGGYDATGSIKSQQYRVQQQQRHQEHFEKLIDDTASAAVERQRLQLAHLQKIAAGATVAGISSTAMRQQLPAGQWPSSDSPTPAIHGGHRGGMGPPAARHGSVACGPLTATAADPDSQALPSPFENTLLCKAVAGGWAEHLQAPTCRGHVPDSTATSAPDDAETGPVTGWAKRSFQEATAPAPLSGTSSACLPRSTGDQVAKRLRLAHPPHPGLRLMSRAGLSTTAATVSGREQVHPALHGVAECLQGTTVSSALRHALEQTWEVICSSTQQQLLQQQQPSALALDALGTTAAAFSGAHSPQYAPVQQEAAVGVAGQLTAAARMQATAASVHPRSYTGLLMDKFREQSPQINSTLEAGHAAAAATAANSAQPAAAATGAAAPGKHDSEPNSNSVTKVATGCSTSPNIMATDAVHSPTAQPVTAGAHTVAATALLSSTKGTHLSGSLAPPAGLSCTAMHLAQSSTPTLPAPLGVTRDPWAQASDPVKQKVLVQDRQQQSAWLQDHHWQRQAQQAQHVRQGLQPAAREVAQLAAVPAAEANTPQPGEAASTSGRSEPGSAVVAVLQVAPPPPAAAAGAASGAVTAVAGAAAGGEGAGLAAEPSITSTILATANASAASTSILSPSVNVAPRGCLAAAELPLQRHNSAPVTTGFVGHRQAANICSSRLGAVTTHGPEPSAGMTPQKLL